MPYDPKNDVEPEDQWAVVWEDGYIARTARTQTEAIDAFLALWRDDGRSRETRWRRWKRGKEGFRVRLERVVTISLSREAAMNSAIARTKDLLSRLPDDDRHIRDFALLAGSDVESVKLLRRDLNTLTA